MFFEKENIGSASSVIIKRLICNAKIAVNRRKEAVLLIQSPRACHPFL